MRAGPLLILACLLLAPTAAAASVHVKVLGGFFDPASLDIQPGDEVTWTNEDSMAHTVTSTWDQGKSFDVILREGESFTYTFPEEGTWGVHCRPHAGMEMKVNALAATGDSPAPASETAEKSSLIVPLLLAIVVPLLIALVVGRMLPKRQRL